MVKGLERRNDGKELFYNVDKRIVLITHNDLDALGCTIVLQRFLRKTFKQNQGWKMKPFVKYYLNNTKFSEEEDSIFKRYGKDSVFIFADICPLESTITKMIGKEIEFYVFDHHDSNLRFNNDDNIIVKKFLEDGVTSACGTTLLHEFLLGECLRLVLGNKHGANYEITNGYNSGYNCFEETEFEKEFYKIIGEWDTFDWAKNIPIGENIFSSKAVMLDIGLDGYIASNRKNKTRNMIFDELSDIISETLEEEKEFEFNNFFERIGFLKFFLKEKEKIEECKKNLLICPSQWNIYRDEIVDEKENKKETKCYNFAYVGIENGSYISIINEMLKREFKEKDYEKYDFLIYITLSAFNFGFSFRNITDKFPLDEIAVAFNGGGHKNASGCPLPKKIKEDIFFNIAKYFTEMIVKDSRF